MRRLTFSDDEGRGFGDVSADRMTEDVDRRDAERAKKIGRVVSRCFHRVGRFATRTRGPGVVEQDHGTARGKSVRDCMVPVVHPGAVMRHKDQRHAATRSKPTVGKANSVSCHKFSRSSDVGFDHVSNLQNPSVARQPRR
jgi:hypothetical protein